MTKYKIRNVRYSNQKGWPAHDADMAILLGRKGSKWPDEGFGDSLLAAQGTRGLDTWEVPIKVWVEPKTSKTSFMRVKCECPGCHRVLAVGRLAQHKCRADEKGFDPNRFQAHKGWD